MRDADDAGPENLCDLDGVIVPVDEDMPVATKNEGQASGSRMAVCATAPPATRNKAT